MRRLMLLAVLAGLVLVPTHVASSVVPTPRDGPAPCSAGAPPYPYHGECATFNGNNTFYGSYGPGFPTPLGWGLCAHHAAGGGAYPAPGYDYTLSSAPTGSNSSSDNSLGWAMSEAQRLGWWQNGESGQFTADEIAVAAKLLYDHLVWAEALPTLDAATSRALAALEALVAEATGMTAPPVVTLALQGGGTTLETIGQLNVAIVAPGSNKGLSAQSVTLTLVGAKFDANHLATITVTTNASGFASATFSTNSLQPSTITASSVVTLGQPGLLFYGPTRIILDAQIIAGPRAPVADHNSLNLTATGQPTGTVQVHKTGDDPSYLSVADGVFEVLGAGQQVLDTLTSDSSGFTQVSGPLPVGAYTIREIVPPAGYLPASDQTVSVVANQTALVEIGPVQGDVAQRGSVTVTKLDAETQTPIGGVTFSIAFDPNNRLVPDGPIAYCTTDESGSCMFGDLLPGHYEVDEVSAPPNYLPADPDQWIHVGPGEHLSLTYHDVAKMVALDAHKFNGDNGEPIAGAVYDLYSKDPGPPTSPPEPPPNVEQFPGYTYQQSATTDSQGQLSFAVRAGYEWCIHEVYVPSGYVIDPALHCTGVVARSDTSAFSLAETTSNVSLTLHKFTSGDPNAGIPEAYYALFVRDPFPVGYTPAPAPAGLVVPSGMTMWAIGYTNVDGHLAFSVPSGNSWCVRELTAPVDYVLDPALHCTTTLTTDSPADSTHVAIAELAYTGSPFELALLALALFIAGSTLWAIGRRRSSTSS